MLQLAPPAGVVPAASLQKGAFHERADKTVDKELEDAIAVCETRSTDTNGATLHVIGLSTGAIIASLLRDKRVVDTFAVIAGLLDIRHIVAYDFSLQQLAQLARDDACWKARRCCKIHGDADQNVQVLDGEELFASTNALKRFVRIPTANHLLSASKHPKNLPSSMIKAAPD
ncbi:hypothetical protein PybrP1_013203 [[Pythium] brassicae (nom. inval.)]|nr:hypothetical protein PybrP1_013203 [[Pythium] brassicae (nom. inval.)]